MGVSLSGVVMAHVTRWLVRTAKVGAVTFETFGWVTLCAAPIVWFLVVGRPGGAARSTRPVASSDGGEPGEAMRKAPATISTRQALREPNLWIISVSDVGWRFMGTTAIMTHVFAFATDLGLGDEQACLDPVASSRQAPLPASWCSAGSPGPMGERGAFIVALVMQGAGNSRTW